MIRVENEEYVDLIPLQNPASNWKIWGLGFLGFCGFARELIFLGKLRLKVKRFVRGILIDSSAASRRNPPKSFMDRGGVVSH